MSYLDDPDVQAFTSPNDKLGKELENPNVRKYLAYLNSDYLGNIVFNNSDKLKKLNKISNEKSNNNSL